MRTRTRAWRLLAVLLAFGLVAAACGDSDDAGDVVEDAVDDAGDAVDDAADDATEAVDGTDDTTDASASAGSGGCPEPDASLDEAGGNGAGIAQAAIQCGLDEPLEAEGEPILIGVQNHEGDPAGSFPEYTEAIEAAADFINSELGGMGADMLNRVPGRPIEIEVCAMPVNPADSQRCANELAGSDPFAVLSTINFFGNHFPVYEAAGVPVVVGTPISVADFTSPGVYSIGAGGGCLGVHTGMVEFAATDLEGQRIGVPWADTPPGVVCYYDLEAKPLNVLSGDEEGSSDRAGSIPDLEHIGVPIVPATPDMTPQVTEVLGFDPDVVIFSAQGADCWNFVDTMGRLGWTPEEIPLVLSGACLDLDALEAAGDLANGIYFINSSGTLNTEPSLIEGELDAFEAMVYQTKSDEYGLAADQRGKGFATQGWNSMMAFWELSQDVVLDGNELTQDTFVEEISTTENQHLFGSTPIGCATAPEPYVAVCNSLVTAQQWDGENLITVRPKFTGIDLLEGTELRTGPS